MDEAMSGFIKRHRNELINHIRIICPTCSDFSYDAIEDHILNDEGLYNWAKAEGVDV